MARLYESRPRRRARSRGDRVRTQLGGPRLRRARRLRRRAELRPTGGDPDDAGVLLRRARPLEDRCAADQLARGDWWGIFGDPELDDLEALALEGNQRLKAAVARLEQARATADVARSGLFPRIGAGAAAVRQHDSEDWPLATTGVAAGKAFTYDTFSVPFDLSWDLDLFGRQRRQLEGARARAAAEIAELGAVRLALTAEVAADYFAVRSLDDERTLLVRGVENFRRALDLCPGAPGGRPVHGSRPRAGRDRAAFRRGAPSAERAGPRAFRARPGRPDRTAGSPLSPRRGSE